MLGALPGIREIRSALAGGYLWIAFLWLALDPGLDHSDFTSEPYRSAHHLGNDLGPVALGVTATFAAYLIGTFFNETRGVIARFYLRARQSATNNISAKRRSDAFEAQQQRRERRQRRREERLSRLKENREARLEKDTSREEEPRPALAQFIYGLSRGAVEALALFGRGTDALSSFSTVLTEALFEVTEMMQELFLDLMRRITSIRIEPYKPFASEQGIAAIKRYLEQEKNQTRIKFNSKEPARSAWPTVADVIADFPILRTRLIHESPDTVSEYDRLRAEADFRSAIVPPLLAIIMVFALKVSWLWSLAALLLLILLATARQKRREAGDILADTLGVVAAPCVEDAKRNPAFAGSQNSHEDQVGAV